MASEVVAANVKMKFVPFPIDAEIEIRTFLRSLSVGKDSMKTSHYHYLLSVILLTLMSCILVVTILYLRPLSDPLAVMGGVVGAMAPITLTILNFLKTQEVKDVAQDTHKAVNSRLDTFIQATSDAARSEGMAQGVTNEQDRVEHNRVKKNKESGKHTT